MDWSLLIFAVVVVLFTWRGYKKGLLKSLSRVLSLLLGYIAAILYSAQVSALLESQLPLKGILAFISAALLLFFGAGIVVSLIFWLIENLLAEKQQNSAISSYGGATLGLLMGVIVAIMVVWSFAFLRDMRFVEETDAVLIRQPSGIEKLSGRVAASVVGSAMSLGRAIPEVSRLSAALIEEPVEIAQQARRLSRSNELQGLLQDPHNQAVLNSGDAVAVQQLPAFRQLLKNPDMLALAKSAGMLDESRGDAQAVEAALARKLTGIWQRTQQVKNDTRLQAILNDPEFQQKLQSGNSFELLGDSRLLELADIIFSDNAATDDGSTAGGMPALPKQESKIYRWTDKNGKIHYADVKPDS